MAVTFQSLQDSYDVLNNIVMTTMWKIWPLPVVFQMFLLLKSDEAR